MTDEPTVNRYSPSVRVLHWLTAALVFTALIVGFALANALADRTVLLAVHTTIGALILVITIIRIANRVRRRAPAMPSTVGRWERRVILGSEVAFYALLLAQPLLGWSMLSAESMRKRSTARLSSVTSAASRHSIPVGCVTSKWSVSITSVSPSHRPRD